jgi:hypothetical protein
MAPNGASPTCRQDDQIKMNPDYDLTLEETMTPRVGIGRLRYRDHRLAPHHRTTNNTGATDRPAGPVLLDSAISIVFDLVDDDNRMDETSSEPCRHGWIPSEPALVCLH